MLAPWTLRKIVAAGLGLTVVTGPVAAAAGRPADVDRRDHAAAAIDDGTPPLGTDLPPLDRPADAAAWSRSRPATACGRSPRDDLGPTATDAEIADAWPLWYAANRAVIGADPNLLQPGQQLVVPA